MSEARQSWMVRDDDGEILLSPAAMDFFSASAWEGYRAVGRCALALTEGEHISTAEYITSDFFAKECDSDGIPECATYNPLEEVVLIIYDRAETSEGVDFERLVFSPGMPPPVAWDKFFRPSAVTNAEADSTLPPDATPQDHDRCRHLIGLGRKQFQQLDTLCSPDTTDRWFEDALNRLAVAATLQGLGDEVFLETCSQYAVAARRTGFADLQADGNDDTPKEQ